MDEFEEIEFIYKQDEYESEDEWDKHTDWPHSHDEIIKILTASDAAGAIEQSIEEKKSDETIISSSSNEIESVTSLESVQSLVHPCLKQISISNSQLKFLNLYNFYPVPQDPGINEKFWILYPHPPHYKSDGVNTFFDTVKSLGLMPVSCMRQLLMTDEVSLRYYGIDAEIIQAVCKALLSNTTVKSLDLQDNILTEDACYYLNKLLMRNNILSSLNLTSCKVGVNGAMRLEEGISLSSALSELNLSNCELGNEGFKYLARAVAVNTLLKILNISNNNLDEDSAANLQEMLTLNDSLKYINLSWNNFNTKIASEQLFNGLMKNSSLTNVDLSWNSMSKNSINYLSRCVINSKNIECINITANRFTDDDAAHIGRALILNRSLNEFHMSKNPIRSNGVTELINRLTSNKFIESPLIYLNLESYWATKDVLPVIEHLKQMKPNFIIKLGGIIGNYQIVGPDLKELYFKMANYEAMNTKKKKDKKNFGHFVLALPNTNIGKDNFIDLITNAKIKISDNLTKEIMKQFMVTKKSLSQAAMKESYMSYFPDTKLPEPPRRKKSKITNNKEEKKTIKKVKGQKEKKIKKGK